MINNKEITGLNKPLLFMVFNRPEKTQQVFNEIQKAKPAKLYISCDGARENFQDDQEKVALVKEIVSDQNITWPCEVRRLYQDKNLGVSMAGYRAFQWVFSQEEWMIQLEDDCLPTQTFFRFCDELLEKYKDNEKISYITCNNNSGVQSGSGSYFFSRYGGSWGWATWKRVWDGWDYLMSDWPKYRNSPVFKNNFRNREEYLFWKIRFQQAYESLNAGLSKSYDIQGLYSNFKNNRFSVYPNSNLVTNIGWDTEASNTYDENSKFAATPRIELDSLIHPENVDQNYEADERIFKYHFFTGPEKRYTFEKYILKKSIKRFLRRDSYLRSKIYKS